MYTSTYLFWIPIILNTIRAILILCNISGIILFTSLDLESILGTYILLMDSGGTDGNTSGGSGSDSNGENNGSEPGGNSPGSGGSVTGGSGDDSDSSDEGYQEGENNCPSCGQPGGCQCTEHDLVPGDDTDPNIYCCTCLRPYPQLSCEICGCALHEDCHTG